MSSKIGVNLRVTGDSRIGGRSYMEDYISVSHHQTVNGDRSECLFFGIFDGHGGWEAADYAKNHLMTSITHEKLFWSEQDSDVLKAITNGFLNTHYAMWKEREKWSRQIYGYPSTAGTTASVAFIRNKKIYIGHVGDSRIVLGYETRSNSAWAAKHLTCDHTPDSEVELLRIQNCGGKVMQKNGVSRVVWNRTKLGHTGPIRRSTHIIEVPFLAIARSLGDLWSYNSKIDEFVISPYPDTAVIEIEDNFKCLIFASDGLWNMLSALQAVNIVFNAEKSNSKFKNEQFWENPSELLVSSALNRWSLYGHRADNTSALTVMLDPIKPFDFCDANSILSNETVIIDKHNDYPKINLTFLTAYAEESNRCSSYELENRPKSIRLRNKRSDVVLEKPKRRAQLTTLRHFKKKYNLRKSTVKRQKWLKYKKSEYN